MKKQEENNKINFVFFGTSNFSVFVLEELKKNNLTPSLIVTTEDKPKGRKLILTPPEVKIWAEKEGVKYIQLKTLRKPESLENIKSYSRDGFDLFIVASYGKIIPQDVLDIPKFKTLNVHPSLLPKLRGASPLQSSILEENETGVTIIELDADVDHGPILAQEKIHIEWPPYMEELEKITGKLGGEMLSKIIPKWVHGEIDGIEQKHNEATFTKKIEKIDGELNLDDSPEKNLRKIRAYSVWPGAYYFEEIGGIKKRIIVKRAHIENGELIIEKVIPEGKKEMDYKDFLRGLKNKNS
jgi:methionyl-tRNA formyltransferase